MGRLPGIDLDRDGDAELVAAARAGERPAMERLLRRHHDRLYAVCRRVTGDDVDAADATQDAMIAIVRGLASFDGRASFSTWSHRVALNAALDELRRRRRRPLPALDGTGPRDGGSEPGGVGRPVPSDEGRGARGGDLGADVADRLDIDAALGRLPTEFKVAVVLRDLAGLPYAEIADILDVPVGTVRSRIARGRDALAALLPDRGPAGGARFERGAPR
ncbi:sigma-70 family RNA polymerase sigma factor [Acidiferrimicrobium sp. IK]|uniref:RNA polymerase sigma factor n=1 Tax=Acidiferrimicrobium sp. IK TaxID=2871700 RepID=UPI0021CB3F67|nr:sigma-70 family RNA polymerase sigma factor [Acidiferrimicrobium sp. IK]MCU4182971.1 sigma-70 family RNA polymerase sigma factor [Acidiferrimicrobium sp. IK]